MGVPWVLKRFISAGFLLTLLGAGLVITAPSYADGGSSSVGLGLIVLPGDGNTSEAGSSQDKSAQSTPYYDSDTTASLTERDDSATYKVWVSI